MKINIVLNKENTSSIDMANAVHEALHGNQDYIDCNIVLNFDTDPNEINLVVNSDKCVEDTKALLKQVLSNVVDQLLE